MAERNNQDGAYVIQEQGDLGLGTTPIDKRYVSEDGKISIPKEAVGFDQLPMAKRFKKIM